jgi:hypothetical protein
MNNEQKYTEIYKFANLLISFYLCPNETKKIEMMAEASFTGFIRTILIIILIFLGIRILMSAFAPSIMRFFLTRMSQRMQKEFERAQNQYQQNASSKIALSDKLENKQLSIIILILKTLKLPSK